MIQAYNPSYSGSWKRGLWLQVLLGQASESLSQNKKQKRVKTISMWQNICLYVQGPGFNPHYQRNPMPFIHVFTSPWIKTAWSFLCTRVPLSSSLTALVQITSRVFTDCFQLRPLPNPRLKAPACSFSLEMLSAVVRETLFENRNTLKL